MDTGTARDEIVYEIPRFVKIFKDGRIERLRGTDHIPAGTDLKTGVTSRDITMVSSEHNLSARLYLPKLNNLAHKRPLLLYFHAGGFCLSSPFCATHHDWVSSLVSEANVVVVSASYRLAPEHPLPAAYEDAWAALQWLDLHNGGDGPEPWLNDHADFRRVFLAGVSSGANMAHNLCMMAGVSKSLNLNIVGMTLEHPYFWGSDTMPSEYSVPVWRSMTERLCPIICPSMPSNDDPRLNPVAKDAPSLVGLGCRRVLVCVAEKDIFKDRARLYYRVLGQCGWAGSAKIFESKGVSHTAHLFDLEGKKTKELIKRLSAFYNADVPSETDPESSMTRSRQ